MGELVIKFTPRRIERIIFFVIIIALLFMGFYYFREYAQLKDGCSVIEKKETKTEEIPSETTTQKEAEKTTNLDTKEQVSQPETKNETKEEPKSEQKDTTGANASSKDTGKVELIVKWPPSYQVKESGTFKKAVIDQMYFTVINSLSTDITPKVNIYFWDSSSSDGFKTSVKDTVTIQTMRPSTKVESSYKVDNLNLYNLDLTKTFKFEIVYDKKNASVIKTLDIE